MSRTEIRALGSFVISAFALWYLQMKFMDGWQIVDLSGRGMLRVFIMVIVATIIAQVVLNTSMAAGGVVVAGSVDGSGEDEREKMIDARADRMSHWFLVAVVNIIAIQLILQEVYPWADTPRLSIISTTGVVFTLLALLYAADLVKSAAIVLQHRI